MAAHLYKRLMVQPACCPDTAYCGLWCCPWPQPVRHLGTSAAGWRKTGRYNSSTSTANLTLKPWCHLLSRSCGFSQMSVSVRGSHHRPWSLAALLRGFWLQARTRGLSVLLHEVRTTFPSTRHDMASCCSRVCPVAGYLGGKVHAYPYS